MSVLTSTAADPVRLTCAGAADATTAAAWRRFLDRWLEQRVQGPAEIREDIVLSVNEALANCVEHAYRGHRAVGGMRLYASYDPAAHTISVRVSDRGTWHRPVRRRPDDPFASRGIMLMHTLADHCTINARSTGTTVCLNYSIPAESSATADN
ncbi:ATP-binding protein [Mycobacterium asiaticum]|uniref:Anti-sigma regulatory factor n=1 Tax=Mycobacterium asiaticum TaxID=1790 RepID=A0A1A3KCI0_MYCAS|nr:ATP-binding protein [Mycobacterium asiaticum]OBJ82119.1 anti-sigma regulatory factor [Mycobacterium asiaticum]ORA11625.1 anti-sigma regulatory factor [Mycobacterium asiaticum DSM 44297]